ncbi:MAG: hypothetical protein RJA36_130 [Pseudomonadota bacterium]|jgi:putative SOS response-associated peptidase YedK
MLMINAGDHPLMRQLHKPQDTKRMVVILPEERYHDWLHAPLGQAARFLTQYPADRMFTA